ncbi:MAG: hypothetical protein AAF637_01640 [Pseudomonadota bacterium]
MPETTRRRAQLALTLLVGLALAGCAMIEREETEDTEQLLAAAGFTMRPADTAEKLADLERYQQHTLIRREREGQVTYVYADAADCKCLYTGNEQNYDAFENLQVQQNIAEEEQMAASEAEQASMNWEVWGPW